MPINEVDTCRTHAVRELYSAVWEDTQVGEQNSFAIGRIMPAGNRTFRRLRRRLRFPLRFESPEIILRISMSPERQIEEQLIDKLQSLKYEYRHDIRDRDGLVKNFREKFQSLNRVQLDD